MHINNFLFIRIAVVVNVPPRLIFVDCPCAGEKPANLEIEDDEKSSEPLATNGEVRSLMFAFLAI